MTDGSGENSNERSHDEKSASANDKFLVIILIVVWQRKCDGINRIMLTLRDEQKVIHKQLLVDHNLAITRQRNGIWGLSTYSSTASRLRVPKSLLRLCWWWDEVRNRSEATVIDLDRKPEREEFRLLTWFEERTANESRVVLRITVQNIEDGK